MRRVLTVVSIIVLAVSIGNTGAGRTLAAPAPAALTGVDHLDPDFGDHGVVRLSEPGSSVNFLDFALQPDGNIVVAGEFQNSLLVARYTPSGTLDASFGGTGIVTTTIGTSSSFATTVMIQPDSKILVGGSASDDIALARYSAAGILDTSFGGTGVVTASIRPESSDTVAALAIQPDGKIVVACSTSSTRFGDALFVARYTSSGALDTSFSGGIASANLTYDIFQRTGMAIQPDGRIVVAGKSGSAMAVSRLTSAGARDSSFGLEGVATTDSGPDTFAYADALALQPDGKIIAAGRLLINGPPTFFALARYTSTGAPDLSFGDGGKVLTAMNTGDNQASALALLPDGKIVAGGMSSTFCTSVCDWRFALARYQPDGRLDRSLGGAGSITSDLFGRLAAVAIQPDGKFVAVGATISIFGQPTVALLARFVDDADAIFLPLARR
ncbi:MAG TPA: hypothetical protein VFU22_20860 [Roseiflexaceae bacterium]|nr:hypothetical protein [Roseiflexaceae bacterium]